MSPWWRVSWSVPAAMRAVRATIVIPSLFALTFKVIHDEQMVLFAVFGGFGALVLSSFGGSRADKALAHLGLAVAGSVTLIIGTLVSSSTWLAAVVTVPVAFAVYFSGSLGPNAAAGVTACLLAYVLPVASIGSAAMLGSRLAGWWLAAAASTAAVVLLSPPSPGDRLRSLTAASATALSAQLGGAVRGTATPSDREASVAAKQQLMDLFVAAPYRPIGIAAADQGLAKLIHLLEWCTSLVSDAVAEHSDLRGAAPQDLDLLAASAQAFGQVASLLRGEDVTVHLEPLLAARMASARHLHELSASPAELATGADHAFHAQAIGLAAAAALADAMVAARRAGPGPVADRHWGWPASEREPAPAGGLGLRARAATLIATDASLRSVWFLASARGAIAIAAAVAVAKLTDVQHAFWVVLGTLSVLRTSATATGATALRGLAGTVAGFIVGAALLVGIGTAPAALWIAFPLAVLVAAYTPGTAPFVAGQAAFTVTIVVLYNLIAPAGWQVGLLRVEDVAIGCAVSLLVGVLFWPRGISGVVGDNLADAYRCGADYLVSATGWALGDSARRPEHAAEASAAGTRIDDAIRGFLTEQGSKRVAKSDLWALVMAATRLRLTAHSLASLPGPNGRTPDTTRKNGHEPHAAIEHRASQLADFYQRLAACVARPAHQGTEAAELAPVPPPGASPAAGLPALTQPEALWVGHHLDDLALHSAAVAGPAQRLAAVRRRPWWR
ncbi:MAG TPA: FUSC family protein [Streptosporangiaceae bacterium]